MMEKIVRKGIVLCGLVLLLLALTGCRKKYSMADYVRYEAVGYNGYGSVDAYFDVDAFEKDCKVPKEYVRAVEKIKVKVNKNENLSNGDTVIASVVYGTGLDDSLKAVFTDLTTTITVKGLEDAESYDPFQHVTFTYEGVSGYATAFMSVDDPYISEEHYYMPEWVFGTLTNGDSITVALDYSSEDALVEEYGIILESLEKTFVIDDIEEPPVKDFFDDIDVTFIGANGYGSLSMEQKNEDSIPLYEFEANQWDELSNGDTVTISLVTEPYFLYVYYGYVPKVTEKTYTVSGLPEKLTSVNDLTQDAKTTMDEAATAYYETYMSKHWSSNEELQSMTRVGEVFFYTDDQNADPVNVACVIYKITVKNKDSEPYTFFWGMGFKDLHFDTQGKIVVDKYEYYKITDGEGSGSISNTLQVGSFKYYGYEETADLIDAIKTLLGSDYSYDKNF